MEAHRANASRRLVLVVSASVGAGHNAAARALTDALAADAPDLDVRWVDLLTLTPRVFRAYYAGGFALGVSRLPLGYGLGFWLTDRPQRPGRSLEERRRLWFERLAMGKLARFLCAQQPALILATHFLAAPLVARLRDAGRLRCPQMLVVTDHLVHRFWYSEGVARWFLPSAYSLERLRRWGIEAGRITISGMPIHRKWTQPVDAGKVRAHWRLPADRKVVLVSGGTDFTCGPVASLARRLARARDDVHVVVLGGRNKKLLARLARFPEAGGRLVGLGFTDRIHELVHVASLMVTKAGGLTTAECLAKGTPMVLLKPVPGHEAGNARYLAGEGVAVIARGTADAIRRTCSLLDDEAARSALSASARRLYRPATETITAAVRDALGA